MDSSCFIEEKAESRLYVGNLDLRITEASLIKMFSPHGKIVSEDFLLHTRVPRGEARLAKERMHGKLACGRPLVVRLVSEKSLEEAAQNSSKSVGVASKSSIAGGSSGQMSRSAKVAAIKNKLRALEEKSSSAKKQKQS